jgi:hypothetical protein
VTWWQQLGLISGTIIAVLTLLGLAARGLLRVWHLARKLNRWLDSVAGDRENGIPSLMDQVEGIRDEQVDIKRRLADHLEWHGDPNAQPAARPAPARPNGGIPPRRRP